jgi:slime mold repeat-containing protein
MSDSKRWTNSILTALVVGTVAMFALGNRFPLAAAADEVFVSNYTANKVTVYARTATGDIAPVRTIQTGLANPHTLAVDLSRQEFFVSNNLGSPDAAINVYDLNASFPGNDTPKRTIAGPLTLLNRPSGLAIDSTNQELYVANDVDSGPFVAVYSSGASGNVAPLRILQGELTGINGPAGMAVDLLHDELFIVNYKVADGGSITVFSRTASGNVAPLRTLQGSGTLFKDPQGIALDAAHDEIVVANSMFSTGNAGNLLVFSRLDSGNTAPSRQISGASTGLCNPIGLILDPVNDEIVVANSHFGSNGCAPSATAYSRTSSGDAAPNRQLGPGPSSALSNPTSVFVTTVAVDCSKADNGTHCDDGNACTQTDTCQAGACVGGDPVVCTSQDKCHDDGVCDPASGVCSSPATSCADGNLCTSDSCDPDLGCLHVPISCDDGNPCTADSCAPASGCVHTGGPAVCDDGNPCTVDSCGSATGCVHTGVDGPDNSCGRVTDTSYCELPTGLCGTSPTGPAFRLIDLQNPTFSTIQNKTVLNDYVINASNPGQFYYNVFQAGAPGAPLNLTIDVPYPFVTQGANPIQVHDGARSSGGCYVPNPSLAGFTITSDGGAVSPAGDPIILRSDYGVQNLGSTTHVIVTGTLPASGLVYVTIHLDYGLKKTTGWQAAANGTTAQGPDTNLDGALDGLGGGPIFIASPQPYAFDFNGGSATHTSTPSSCNKFKKNPGVNGNALRLSTSSPAPNVRVQFFKPTGALIASTTTDADGFYQFVYKATGKTANYTVKLPDYGKQKTVTLKANGYARADFEDLP